MTIQLSVKARGDVGRILDYSVREFGFDHARELVNRFEATLNKTIGRFPASGRLRSEFGIGIRSYVILPYVVFYRVTRGRISVLRILHGKRDIHEPLMSLLIAG